MRKLALLLLCFAILASGVSFVIYARTQNFGDNPTVAATPNELWPPTNLMVPIELGVYCDWNNGACTLENPCACCKEFQILGVTANEPIRPGVDFAFTNVAHNRPQLSLKASHRAGGSGRIYYIRVSEYSPICCKAIEMTVTVTVPRRLR
jgi:hypothetical protein